MDSLTAQDMLTDELCYEVALFALKFCKDNNCELSINTIIDELEITEARAERIMRSLVNTSIVDDDGNLQYEDILAKIENLKNLIEASKQIAKYLKSDPTEDVDYDSDVDEEICYCPSCMAARGELNSVDPRYNDAIEFSKRLLKEKSSVTADDFVFGWRIDFARAQRIVAKLKVDGYIN